MAIRPIDANELKLALNQSYNDPESVVDDAPTLDYAPVRHGEWIDEIEPDAVTASGREVHVFRCSACDFTWANKTDVLHYFKHCPNCGAKMGKDG